MGTSRRLVPKPAENARKVPESATWLDRRMEGHKRPVHAACGPPGGYSHGSLAMQKVEGSSPFIRLGSTPFRMQLSFGRAPCMPKNPQAAANRDVRPYRLATLRRRRRG
jgi:hypothetical protein